MCRSRGAADCALYLQFDAAVLEAAISLHLAERREKKLKAPHAKGDARSEEPAYHDAAAHSLPREVHQVRSVELDVDHGARHLGVGKGGCVRTVPKASQAYIIKPSQPSQQTLGRVSRNS